MAASVTTRICLRIDAGATPVPRDSYAHGLPAEGFLRHRGLILVAAGGAVAEGSLLTLAAPAARSIAPQLTALPSVAAYHDLRGLFTDTQ